MGGIAPNGCKVFSPCTSKAHRNELLSSILGAVDSIVWFCTWFDFFCFCVFVRYDVPPCRDFTIGMGESHPDVCTVCFPGTCNRPREWGFELSSASLKETMFHLYIKWKGQDKNPRTPFAMQYLCHYTTGSRTQPQQVSCIPKGDDVSPLHQVERSR